MILIVVRSGSRKSHIPTFTHLSTRPFFRGKPAVRFYPPVCVPRGCTRRHRSPDCVRYSRTSLGLLRFRPFGTRSYFSSISLCACKENRHYFQFNSVILPPFSEEPVGDMRGWSGFVIITIICRNTEVWCFLWRLWSDFSSTIGWR